MTAQELMRHLLTYDLDDVRDMAAHVPNEIVCRSLIIREFMEARDVEDPRQGIRQFYAFKRERLRELGFHGGPGPATEEAAA